MKANITVISAALLASLGGALCATPAWAHGAAHEAHEAHKNGKPASNAASDETSIGKPGLAAHVTRTIEIEMSDNMRYTPSTIQAKRGETLRLIAINMGVERHELSLGTQKELLEHLELMKKFPDMVHDEPNKVTVDPGQKGEIIWQFTKSGTIHFACLMPKHYEGGMRGTVVVAKPSFLK